MKGISKSNYLAKAVAACVVLLGLLAGTFYLHLSTTTHSTGRKGFVLPAVAMGPRYLAAGNPDSGGFGCQAPSAAVHCYGPSQIRAAYDIQRVLDAGITGKGRTIVIIDAFQSPTIRHDLNLFDKVFGLPNPKFNIIAPQGLTPFNPKDPNQVGWSAEISLDVEWAHAIAPDATIDLVLAKSNMDPDLLSVTKFAVDRNLGDVISQSFGEGESCATSAVLTKENKVFQEAVAKRITLFASSGDEGAAQPTCNGNTFFRSASTPASNPLVVGVGGTHLDADLVTGTYFGESAWNDSFGASGGGFSTLFSRPAYQKGFNPRSRRGVPDVAYNGDVNGGVLVAWSSSGMGKNLIFIFGGTSAGSPQWAGMLALVDSHFGRQGDIHSTLYQGFASHGYTNFFHDIVVGNNTFTGAGSNGKTVTIVGYDTGPGWDPVTGLGSLILGNTIFGPSGASTAVSW